ncbi:MAG TPA: 2-hydroxyacyl-CoA dehydratase family protein, partial [Candidatus Bathyarchaeia archaeon]|nr:2-hydroxyacyl-CoA dehydratase family protein [Candidatus Bathyarchaeia archaeon]
DCACFTPNDERLENIKSMSKKLHADGVIHFAYYQIVRPYSESKWVTLLRAKGVFTWIIWRRLRRARVKGNGLRSSIVMTLSFGPSSFTWKRVCQVPC